MQLRYKEIAILKRSSKLKQPNGVKLDYYETIDNYSIQVQELVDELSISQYGADINSMLRISSIRHELETYLKNKLNNTDDNISKYYICINNKQYKIRTVRKKWIDIQEMSV